MGYIQVECWGGGGGGGATGTSHNAGSNGGGGGAYVRSSLFIAPITYTVTVGATANGGVYSTSGGVAGKDSWFNAVSVIIAKGGSSNGNGSGLPSPGGLASLCIGDIIFAGGDSGNCSVNGKEGSGGGGAAGPTSVGGNGQDGQTAATATGGTAGTGGGGGGAGGTGGNNTVGGAGSAVGGGGGGGGKTANSNGGAGAAGQIVITYPTGTVTATGGSITTVGGNTVHTFASTSTFVVSAITLPSSESSSLTRQLKVGDGMGRSEMSN